MLGTVPSTGDREGTGPAESRDVSGIPAQSLGADCVCLSCCGQDAPSNSGSGNPNPTLLSHPGPGRGPQELRRPYLVPWASTCPVGNFI